MLDKLRTFLGLETRASAEGMEALFGAPIPNTGILVGPSNAMRCTAVRCAVQAIAEGVGTLPLHVYERKADGSKERASDHPVQTLLHDAANDWTSSSDFLEQVTRDALLHGNGFAFINRVDGVPRELIRLDPTLLAVERDERTGEPLYKLSEGRGQRYVDRRDIIHIKAPSLNGLTGESPIVQAREAIGLALVMERHAARLFGFGARPSGVLKFKGKLTSDSAARIKASWNVAHGGNKSGSVAVLEEDADWKPITFSSVDAQFLELWQHTVSEIARAFRCPPVLLMDYGRATWGNSEEMGRQFLNYTLGRWLKAWQGELRVKLFTEDERGRFFPEFLLDDLLRSDLEKRATALNQMIAARILSPNEARAMDNRSPYAGGDEFVNPNTMTSREPPAPSKTGADA